MAKAGLMGGGVMQTPPIVADPSSVFRRGQGGILPERGSRAQRDIVQALVHSGIQSAGRSGSPLLALLAPLAGGAVSSRTSGLYKDAQGKRDNAAVDQILAAMGGGSQPVSISARNANPNAPRRAAVDQLYPIGKSGPAPRENVDPATGLNLGELIIETAQAIGADPLDLATAISYETAGTFNPRKKGPTTQWGQHEGLIQFGQPQQRQYGVDLSSDEAAIRSQLGADGAIARYFKASGFKPGMSGLDLYSTINAGSPGRYNASDANNGGAPGSVADKWNNQMSEHRAKAARLLGGDFSTYASAGQSSRMPQDSMRTLIGIMTNGEVSEPIREIAASMVNSGMKSGGSMSPSEQIDLASSMLSLEDAMRPPEPDGRFRAATPEEAARYGATAGQIGPDGRFYPAPSPKNSRSGDAGVLRQQNEATEIVSGAIESLEAQGFSREEALATIARDPIYGPQLQILGIDPADLARQQVIEDAQPAAQGQPGFWSWLFGGDAEPETAAPTQPIAPAIPENDPLGIR